MGSCQSSPKLLCHLPPPEVTFSSASFLLQSIPFPGAQAQQSFIKASLSSLCFGDIVLWISPPRAQPLFKPSGKTLKSLSSKTKAPGAAATGRGEGELITHPEHSLGCSHRPPAPSPATPKPRIQHGTAPELSLEWGRHGGRHSMRIPSAVPLFRADKELSVEELCVCVMTFSRGPCRQREQSCGTASPLGSANAAAPSLLKFSSQCRVLGIYSPGIAQQC